jgi:ribosomal protein S18 acetylase RimI-like enzyme
LPLPVGLEVRPALPEHYHAIWVSVDESSQDEWGYSAMDEDAWLKSFEHFQPELWQIAWDAASGLVAGHVLTFIDHAQNEQFKRKRGYTEGIGVGPPGAPRAGARALIARSLRAQKAAGMTESALTPDSENAGALRLYESCGFQVTRRSTVYRKAF